MFAMFRTVFRQDTPAFFWIETVTYFYTIPGRACASITERSAFEVVDNWIWQFWSDLVIAVKMVARRQPFPRGSTSTEEIGDNIKELALDEATICANFFNF